MLKITRSSDELASKAFKINDNEVVVDSDKRTNETVVNLSKNEKSRSLTHIPNIGAIKELTFLTFDAKKTFNYLWLAFIKASIFQYFDLKSHIQIETNISGYAIGGVVNYLNLDTNTLPNDLNDLNSNKSDFG